MGWFKFDLGLVKVPGRFVAFKTHEQPHGDEYVAALMIRLKADMKFIEKYQVNGYIELGVNKGVFDDHACAEGNGEKKKSCSDLVAEALGIQNEEVWRKILNHVSQNDCNGSQNQKDITSLLKMMNRQEASRQDKHATWYVSCLHVKFYDYKNGNFTIEHIAQFVRGHKKCSEEVDANYIFNKGIKAYRLHKWYFDQAIQELKQKLKKREVLIKTLYLPIGKNSASKEVVVAALQTGNFNGIQDNYRMEAAMRANPMYGGVLGADIPIAKNSKGHVFIGNSKLNFDLSDVAVLIRLSEQILRKHRKVFNLEILRLGGALKKVPMWFYDNTRKPQLLYNGSFSYPNTESTKLSLRQIFEAIILCINPNAFNTKYQDFCQKGKCLGGKSCLLLGCGLKKCEQNWKQTRQASKRNKFRTKNN
ncbi:hypothetical protein DRH27_02870 [Candidatus Falkowbacteria bacterium]|nr:MAG: hypothetical protein DRH27_02870 [Candidatus Falkowbacteria bacterium]